jgi:hypothetical protein
MPQPYCNPSAKRLVYPAHGIRSDAVEEARVGVHGLDNRHTTTPVFAS